MKKFVAIIAVLAVAMMSSVAMAEVTISGSIEIRNLSLNNTNTAVDNPSSGIADRNRTTQERVRINIDAKNDNVKGRVTIENDWDIWGRIETPQANGSTTANAGGGRLELREAWMDFTIPGAGPAHIKVGHQFLQLGNGWMVRHQKYGSDAWLVGLPGKNTIAFVDVKAAEGGNGTADDVDAYVLLDNFKIDDNNTVGAYIMRINDPRGATTGGFGKEANLDTIGVWYAGKVAGINLKAEVDFQMGTIKSAATGTSDRDFSGSQWIIEADMPLGAASVNALIASGSGDDSGTNDNENIVTSLDKDPHYTFVYEYFAKTACGTTNTGFCNTMAIGLGGSYEVTKWMGIDLKAFMLKANEKVALNGWTEKSDDLGTEIDARLRFKLYDNLTWNWTFGRLMTGDAYKTNVNGNGETKEVDAIQGILSYKF